MLIRKLISILLFILLVARFSYPGLSSPSTLNQEFLEIQWNKTFESSDNILVYDVIETDNGDYLLAGRIQYDKEFDIFVVKVDTDGNQIWNNTYGGNHSDHAIAIYETYDSDYFIVGTSYSFPGVYGNQLVSSYEFMWVVKVDSNGLEQWNKTFGGEFYNALNNPTIMTADGGLFLVGVVLGYPDHSDDLFITKIDKNGNEQWNKTFQTSHYEYGLTPIEVDDGYLVVIDIYDRDQNLQDYKLIKLDREGNIQWEKYLDFLPHHSIINLPDNKLLFSSPLMLIKTDNNGTEIWNKTFSEYDDWGFEIVTTADDGSLILGTNNNEELLFKKIDSEGIKRWNQTLTRNYNERPTAIIATRNGAYIAVGSVELNGSTHNIWILKFNLIFENIQSVQSAGLSLITIIIVLIHLPLIRKRKYN